VGVTAGQVAYTIVVVGLASAVQAAVGFGFALLAMPLLAGVIGTEHALAVVSLVSIVNSTSTATTARGHVDRATLRSVSLALLAGLPLGLVILDVLPERAMRFAIAGTVAVAAVALGAGLRVRRGGRIADGLAGFTSGVLSTSTGTSGPPLVVGLQSRGLPAATVRATLAAQFVFAGVTSLVLLALFGHISRADVAVALVCLPLLLATWRLGARTFHRFDQRRYDRAIVALLLAAALVGAWNAL
jgi:hypothetical protein